MPTDVDAIAEWESAALHDQAVGHVYGSDRSALPPLGNELDSFDEWGNVAATIHTRMYEAAAFSPGQTAFSAEAFEKLRHTFVISPYWAAELTAVALDAHIRPGDYGEGVDALRRFYESVDVSPEIVPVISNVKRQAQLASKLALPARKRSMLYTGTLAVRRGVLHVTMVYAAVGLTKDDKKARYAATEESVKIFAQHGALNFDFCKRHADRISMYARKSVEAWTDMAAANHDAENSSEGWPRNDG